MHNNVKGSPWQSKRQIAIAISGLCLVTQAWAQLVIYERSDFSGRTFTTNQDVKNCKRQGFNDRASSAIVLRDRWEVCEDVRFGGHCVVLRPGRYPSFGAMGLNDRISSVRSVQYGTRYNDDRYAPRQIDGLVYELPVLRVRRDG